MKFPVRFCTFCTFGSRAESWFRDSAGTIKYRKYIKKYSTVKLHTFEFTGASDVLFSIKTLKFSTIVIKFSPKLDSASPFWSFCCKSLDFDLTKVTESVLSSSLFTF
ncbi:hypothetical protein BpHYR1_009323 [Brachionus plicatilis]|uniref:Uncharacterized protein n=1 Tax=Brachionus plicatilis TaxID=10195 RepID=A0A3M7SZV9_BRAPC|nr:hypothetical protein BpHYR1_009323 [Brachionus plicatilis]